MDSRQSGVDVDRRAGSRPALGAGDPAVSTTKTAVAPGTARRVAVIVSEALAPIVVIPLVTIVVSLHASHTLLHGAGFAFVAVFFAAALPYAFLLFGVRRGRFDDRQIRARAQRPFLLAFTLASVMVGLVVLKALGAPRDLFALVAAMVAGMAMSLVVSSVWKISIHTSCVAGVVVSLALLVSPVTWWLAPLIVLTGWARVVLGDHTPAQVVAGTALGAVVAAFVVLQALR